MKYVLLIYGSREYYDAATPADLDAMMPEYFALDQDLDASGEGAGGFALVDDTLATTVRVRGDETVVSDGPFAETKEWLGGSFVVEVSSLERAMEIAKRIPDVRHGSIEIRPIREFTGELDPAAGSPPESAAQA